MVVVLLRLCPTILTYFGKWFTYFEERYWYYVPVHTTTKKHCLYETFLKTVEALHFGAATRCCRQDRTQIQCLVRKFVQSATLRCLAVGDEMGPFAYCTGFTQMNGGFF